MNLLSEWVAKAEADYKGAVALGRRRKDPLPDLVCYHCQACAEKYLKALLVLHRIIPPRIHDLIPLLDLCALIDPGLRRYGPWLRYLQPFGVLVRYPGLSASVAAGTRALHIVRQFRKIVRQQLGL